MTTFERIQIAGVSVATAIKFVTVVGIVGTVMTFAIAQSSQARFIPTSAEKLIQQAAALSEAGDRDSALAANRKAVQLYRHLMRVSPIHYQPALAATLQDMSVRLFEAGDREGARSAITEVITMRRHLAPDNARNIASLEESLRILSRFETASEAANTNTAQSSVR
jgi:tetratricopeptide (TPR) repeat protein